jgi:DNA polymerase
MTREDVLRELELLPVWRLRPPIVSEVMGEAPVAPAPAFSQTNIPKTLAIEPTPIVPPIPTSTPEVLALSCTISDDEKWAFIWPADPAPIGLQSTLFSNMLAALHIQKFQSYVLTDINTVDVGVLVVMGETAAQKLLKRPESIEQLRGHTHQLGAKPLIVTYHPSDLLQNTHLKPKTWDDLCLAKRALSA